MFIIYSFIISPSVVAPPEPPQLPGKCPEPKKGESWIPFRGHCYSFSSSRGNWAHASVDCLKLGAPPGVFLGLLLNKSCCYLKSGVMLCSVSVCAEIKAVPWWVWWTHRRAPSYSTTLTFWRTAPPASGLDCIRIMTVRAENERGHWILCRERIIKLLQGQPKTKTDFQVSGCGSMATLWTTPTGTRKNIQAHVQNSTPSQANGGQTPAADTGSTFVRWPKVWGVTPPTTTCF